MPLAANAPLYTLYTSGTTGQPKGILRDNTYAVALQVVSEYSPHASSSCAVGHTRSHRACVAAVDDAQLHAHGARRDILDGV